MEVLNQLLIDYGYWGMFVAGFLAGSFITFSSEAIMLALAATGLAPWPLVVYGTVGNVLGSLLLYAIGRMGKTEWLRRFMHVGPKQIARAERFMQGRGAWMGFFTFVPVLGSGISIVLGLMRANIITTVAMGKFLRYLIIAYIPWLFS